MKLPTQSPTMFSKIKIRRGLQIDLSDLTESEFGFTTDTGEVFIGAPDLPSLKNKGKGEINEQFPFKNVRLITSSHNQAHAQPFVLSGNGDYTPQTGPTQTDIVQRSYQNKFNDIVNLDDFITNKIDVSQDLNRALKETYGLGHKILHISANTYNVEQVIEMPPNSHIKGEGIDKTIIKHTNTDALGSEYMFTGIDHKFQSDIQISTNSGGQPENIIIEDMTIETLREMTMFQWYRAKNITFINVRFKTVAPLTLINVDSIGFVVTMQHMKFIGCTFDHTGPILNSMKTVSNTMSNISFDNCKFNGNGKVLDLHHSSAHEYSITNSIFNNPTDTIISATRGGNIRLSGNKHNLMNFNIGLPYIYVEGAVSQFTQINDVYSAPASYIPLECHSNDGIIITGNDLVFKNVRYSTGHQKALSHSTTNAPIDFVVDLADTEYAEVNYVIRKPNDVQMGKLLITVDDNVPYIFSEAHTSSNTLATFDIVTSTIDGKVILNVMYTTPADGTDSKMSFDYKIHLRH